MEHMSSDVEEIQRECASHQLIHQQGGNKSERVTNRCCVDAYKTSTLEHHQLLLSIANCFRIDLIRFQ